VSRPAASHRAADASAEVGKMEGALSIQVVVLAPCKTFPFQTACEAEIATLRLKDASRAASDVAPMIDVTLEFLYKELTQASEALLLNHFHLSRRIICCS